MEYGTVANSNDNILHTLEHDVHYLFVFNGKIQTNQKQTK